MTRSIKRPTLSEKTKAIDAALPNAAGAIERSMKSKQDQFRPGDPDGVFYSTLNWVKSVEFEEVPQSLDNRKRDAWLRDLWPKEPHLAGVINGAVLIDANRGWSYVGGRNQVNRYITLTHSFENGKGYRMYIRKAALAFRTADLGHVAEIGREGDEGPARTLWAVDPTRCALTGNIATPLAYYPAKGKKRKDLWTDEEFFNINSMPSTDETLYGLGFCGLSRAYELAKIMIGIYKLDQGKLLAKSPEGFLLLQGITQEQWDTAMEDREGKLTAKELAYFGSTFVFASMNEIKAQLIALASLPEAFDRQVFTDILMYAYSLVFGYAADEFWPVRFGALGRGTESLMQERKAVAKGVMDFISLWQEQWQRRIPPTLYFSFDERDIEGEMQDTELKKAKIDAITAMYLGSTYTEGLITRDEARSLLAEEGLIPAGWTELEETVTGTDEEGETRMAKYRQLDAVQRAAYTYPDEPIVRYHWPDGKMTVIAMRGDELVNRRSYYHVKRRADETALLAQNGSAKITQEDVDNAMQEGLKRTGQEIYDLMTNVPVEVDDA